MRGCLGRALGLLALWLLAGVAQAQDDPPGRVGRLAALHGEVWVQEAGQGEWIEALPNRPFTGGERLATAAGASAELHIGSTTVFLGEQTEFEALRLDDERLQFRLQRGRMALRLQSHEVAAELEVLHLEARFMLRRAGFYRVDRLAETSDVTVWRGEMQVEAHNLSLTLHAGQRAAFWREGSLGDTTRQWLTPQQDDFALTAQREDQARAQLMPSELVPAEMTGVEDLQRYGSWQQHPEVGAVWIPSVVASGWAPYRHGQWAWVRPWGWTWVDAAPWGFAPFHYGRWLWWGNRWCWTPGPRVQRPVYAPALVGWVGARPPPGGAWGGRPPPAHGWVPLAPREAYTPGYRVSPGHLKRLNPHLPAGPLPAPAFVNRGAPDAVTGLPSLHGAPRPPAASLRRGDPARGPWPVDPDLAQPRPQRPQADRREHVAPRAALPIEATLGEAPPRRPPVRSVAPPPIAAQPPMRSPPPQETAPAATAVPSGHAPFGGRPRTPTPPNADSGRERLPPAVPAQAVRPAPAVALPQPTPAAVHRPEPAAAAAPGARPGENAAMRRDADLGERRRTPESRQQGRER